MLASQLVLPRTGAAVCMICSAIMLHSSCKMDYSAQSSAPTPSATSTLTIDTSRAVEYGSNAVYAVAAGGVNSSVINFRMLSTDMPHTARADVNGDGLEDVFVCSANGRPRAMYQQQKDGTFKLCDAAVFNNNQTYCDTDCIFFDADGDSDADLFICSVYNALKPTLLQAFDCLYINDGSGNFTLSAQPLPLVFAMEKHTCVSAADFDADGDIDLYIGVHVGTQQQYAYTTSGYLLQNDGNGFFSDVTGQVCPAFNGMGVITGASWIDYDKDGRPDLILAVDNMPIKILHNTGARLVEENIAVPGNNTGCWNRFVLADVNDDGYIDIIAGNEERSNLCKSNTVKAPVHATSISNHTLPPAITCTYRNARPAQPATVESSINYGECFSINAGVLINDKKRGFILQYLPAKAQFSPLYTTAAGPADGNNKTRIIPALNFY